MFNTGTSVHVDDVVSLGCRTFISFLVAFIGYVFIALFLKKEIVFFHTFD